MTQESPSKFFPTVSGISGRVPRRTTQLGIASIFTSPLFYPAWKWRRSTGHGGTVCLDEIFHYLIARGYQPKGTTDSSKQYVLSLLKKHAVLSGSSWHLADAHSQAMPALVGSSSDQGDA